MRLRSDAIGNQIKRLLTGNDLGEMEEKGEYLKIMLRSPELSVSQLESLMLESGSRRIPLSDVARLTRTEAPREIIRTNQTRTAEVRARIAGASSFDRIVARVREEMGKVSLPADYTMSVAGEEILRRESFRNLEFALILAVLLVYMVMAAQFESLVHPFVILLTIPLAVVGAIWVHFALGLPLSIMSYIGIIMLAGIAVNNSIILIDFINQSRRAGMGLDEAIVYAGRMRIRPILMTSITTILGILPMALGVGEGASLRAPLALAVAGGLLTSTALTLLVMPAVYRILGPAAGPGRSAAPHDPLPRPPAGVRSDAPRRALPARSHLLHPAAAGAPAGHGIAPAHRHRDREPDLRPGLYRAARRHPRRKRGRRDGGDRADRVAHQQESGDDLRLLRQGRPARIRLPQAPGARRCRRGGDRDGVPGRGLQERSPAALQPLSGLAGPRRRDARPDPQRRGREDRPRSRSDRRDLERRGLRRPVPFDRGRPRPPGPGNLRHHRRTGRRPDRRAVGEARIPRPGGRPPEEIFRQSRQPVRVAPRLRRLWSSGTPARSFSSPSPRSAKAGPRRPRSPGSTARNPSPSRSSGPGTRTSSAWPTGRAASSRPSTRPSSPWG